MGCQNAKAKQTNPSAQGPTTSDAAEFLRLCQKERHPVAQCLMDEWTVFVNAQVRKNAGDPSAAAAYEARPKEVWADTETNPVTHRSVDYVGKMFLEYIKSDLSQRGWGGNFDYKVAGVAQQGFLKANANVDTASSDVPDEVCWEIKIHYHSSGAS